MSNGYYQCRSNSLPDKLFRVLNGVLGLLLCLSTGLVVGQSSLVEVNANRIDNEVLRAQGEYLSPLDTVDMNATNGQAINFIQGAGGITPKGLGPSSEQLKQAATDRQNWLYHTHDYAGTRFAPLNQITRNNAADMQVVCLNQLGGLGDFQTGPLVYDGVMYVTIGSETVAINAVTCREQWRSQWEYQDQAINSTNRGVAIQDGYVVRGTADGYLIALDSLNGNLLWARQVASPAEGEHFTMAPMIFEDTILIGPAGGNYGISGWIGAFSLLDGEPIWRFHTVPGATQEDSASWGNPLGIKIGGGAVWTPLSLDAENNELFVAVTNPAPDFPAALRPGDNLYTNSILSLNVANGELNWHKQIISADDHGWDLTQVSPLFQAQINNQTRNLIASVGKDGLLRILDRNSQQQLSVTEVTAQLNVNAPVTINGTYTCPGVLGGVLWNGPALEPITGLLITPAVNLCSTFYQAKETRYIAGRNYFGGTVVSDASTLSGWITAVDIESGEIAWQYQSSLPMVAATTTTAGGLLLSGELNGDFIILDSANGKELFRFNTGGAIGGGIVSYQVGLRQYIAVASGRPSGSQVNGDKGSPTIVVFALPEN